MYPDVGTVTVYPDGYVTFEQDAFTVCIFLYICKLSVQMVLYEIILADIIVTGALGHAETVQQGRGVTGLLPLAEIRCAVLVTQVTVESVGLKP